MFEKMKNIFDVSKKIEKTEQKQQLPITSEQLIELKKGLHFPFANPLVAKPLDYSFSELESSAVGAIVNLSFKLKEKLPSYDTIISDDASGRLPSLLFYKIINNLKTGTDSEQKSAQLFFISGGTLVEDSIKKEELKLENIKKFLSSKKLGKVLVVTEFIMTGESMEKIARILDELGVSFDIATISLDRSFNAKKHPAVASRLYFGAETTGKTAEGSAGLNFWMQPSYSGVVKSKKGFSAHPQIYQSEHQSQSKIRQDIKQAREDKDVLADRISELLK
jgi:hypothetical protein